MRRFLLWDHDGVLVDSERWYFEATREIVGRLGVELTRERYLNFMAGGRRYWDLAVDRGVSEGRIRACQAERDAIYRDSLRTKPIDIDGVAEVLAELAVRYRMAIVTTARRQDFDLVHGERDLIRHFEFVLTVEDYERPKPAPDPYEAALRPFGASPAEAVAFEDSVRGLQSCRAAGVDCVVIRNAFTASQDFGEAWRVVDSVRDVPGLLAATAREEDAAATPRPSSGEDR